MATVISPADVMTAIAGNVRRLRGERSYGDLARACSDESWRCYPATIQQIEAGHHEPRAFIVKRLADALGVSVDDICSPRNS